MHQSLLNTVFLQGEFRDVTGDKRWNKPKLGHKDTRGCKKNKKQGEILRH